MNVFPCYVESDTHKKIEQKLLDSSQRVGIELTAFGKGVEWNGNFTKLNCYLEGFKTIDPKYDIILGTDSRDVLYYSNLNEISNIYYNEFYIKGKHLVFNAETNCWPDKNLADQYPCSDKKYRFLNSGCFIGTRTLIEEVFIKAKEIGDKNNYKSDQHCLSLVYLDFLERLGYNSPIELDRECKIFQVLWDENGGRSANFDVIYNKGWIYNQNTNSFPCIFHAPGPTTTLSSVWKILNNQF